MPRHSFEENRGDYHEEECSICIECGEPITPVDDGHNDECDIYKSLIANVQVDLPDTAAQDSASKTNNPAVSG